jgi:Holliday junction resolvase RusA-like endonuclease
MTFFDIPEPTEMLWMTTFPGRIYPLSRPRFAQGKVYQPLDNQKELRNHVFDKKPIDPIDCDVWLDLHFLRRNRSKADCDNQIKAVCDALQSSGVLVNDRQVVGGTFQAGLSDCDHCNIVLRRVERYVHGPNLSN